MVITRVGPVSCAKIVGVLYVILGLIVGGVFSLAAMAGAFANGSSQGAVFPVVFGVAAVFIFPVMYGCIGFIATLIGAWLYNVLAGSLGGIQLDLE